MPERFAVGDNSIPYRLRGRIEKWETSPPKTQYQQYGPLNAFLSIKFPPDRFLVKPQALLREIWQNTAPEDTDAMKAIIFGRDDHTMDVDDHLREEIVRRASIDSYGTLVHADKKYYPDFVVTAYSETGNPHGGEEDIIRLVIEVGSLGRDLKPPTDKEKADIVDQLKRYLVAMGEIGYRWADKAVGMCIVGTEVAIMESKSDGKFKKGPPRWESLYSEKFSKIIRDLATM